MDSAFPVIADYGFISDCEVTALVALSGSVEWMCLPRMDGPSIFPALLGHLDGTSNRHPHCAVLDRVRRPPYDSRRRLRTSLL
jgi:alpha,alpha-trehalase